MSPNNKIFIATVEIITSTSTDEDENDLDIHADTIDAIANGLLIREQDIQNMSLRFIEDGSMEPWQITLTVGKIAEQATNQFQRKLNLKNNKQQSNDDDVLEKTMGGRIAAVWFRLDELEQLLDEQSSLSSSLLDSEEEDYRSLGGILSPSSAEENNDSMLVLKQLILENESFRKAGARSLLALFLHTVEVPGMRRNNITVSSMDIDFLTSVQK